MIFKNTGLYTPCIFFCIVFILTVFWFKETAKNIITISSTLNKRRIQNLGQYWRFASIYIWRTGILHHFENVKMILELKK